MFYYTLQLEAASKTVIFCYILKALFERKKRGLMVVHGRQLVDQGADRLEREAVPHGIVMAGRKPILNAPIYVCSVDTLRARKLRPPADLIVIDEAHMACSESYKALIADYPDAYILAVTATPYVTKSMRHLADAVVSPIGIQGLIDQGYLVRPRYIVPVQHDLSELRVDKKTGDYAIADIAAFFSKSAIIGDICSTWNTFAKGRPTICFAPTIAVSQAIVLQMQEQGIRAAHVEANTPDKERKARMADLCEGRLDVLSNVGILCVGVDLPPVSCILMARPTKSLNLYIQQAGRGTRIHDTKRDFLILDHANNVREHGFITDEHEVHLDGMPKTTRVAGVKVCPECYAASPNGAAVCSECGYEFTDADRTPDHEDGELAEIEESAEEIQVKSFIKETKRTQKAKGYKRGWIYFQICGKFGLEVTEKYMKIPDWARGRIQQWEALPSTRNSSTPSS